MAPVSKSKQHPGPAARQPKVSRRQANEARAELAAGGLTHQERRKLRAVTRARDAAAGLRRGELKHLIIVAAGAIAVMAVVTAATGLISAINAASGQGKAGTFIVGNQPCIARRGGCAWPGAFRSGDGVTMNVEYVGTLPAGAGGGGSIPAIEPAGASHMVYPPHGSRAWIDDLLLVLLAGGVVGLLLWLLPVGLTGLETSGAVR
jgi:hypothetical protein